MLRLGTWNIQWFDHLFDRYGRPRRDAGRSGREGVSCGEQTEAIILVLRALDADGLIIEEAPDARRRRHGVPVLESFAREAGLRTRSVLMGFPSHSGQEIALLYDPDALEARHDPREEGAPRFDGTFHAELDGARRAVTWAKPPLEVALRLGDGTALRVIGVHAKSKNAYNARNPDHAEHLAVENRRKQLAQCLWLRARIEAHLTRAEPLVVMGDFNDGPGLDTFEARFGRSGVEIVLSEGKGPRLVDPHAVAARGRHGAAAPATARFRAPDRRWFSALLDFVMVSPDLLACEPRWRIWHPFDDEGCWRDLVLRRALLDASDHFPVTVDLRLGP
ncbi:endonuclease/exonuclease/phosphatase family protein [Rubellimicrobium sp. CFH 75288]|uniref:endonuclease/exonuclease/phosphatase family protein n=1 Tax=Rubellimicrobium sp. CFH 75288 TaxID=2697034 RepID=UPI001411E511|nr:endonuclease [Rubellimicrobium sp. CFH 75288]